MYAVRGGKLNLKGIDDEPSHLKKQKRKHSSLKKQKSIIDNDEDDGDQDYVQ